MTHPRLTHNPSLLSVFQPQNCNFLLLFLVLSHLYVRSLRCFLVLTIFRHAVTWAISVNRLLDFIHILPTCFLRIAVLLGGEKISNWSSRFRLQIPHELSFVISRFLWMLLPEIGIRCEDNRIRYYSRMRKFLDFVLIPVTEVLDRTASPKRMSLLNFIILRWFSLPCYLTWSLNPTYLVGICMRTVIRVR